jgi:hypothetical protein
MNGVEVQTSVNEQLRDNLKMSFKIAALMPLYAIAYLNCRRVAIAPNRARLGVFRSAVGDGGARYQIIACQIRLKNNKYG